MRGFWWTLAMGVMVVSLGAGDSLLERLTKPRVQIDLENIAAADPRIEVIARALCRAHGLDPDHDAFPYPGPLWERFVLQAKDYLTESDAYDQWRKPLVKPK
jgi:hypothetical protein